MVRHGGEKFTDILGIRDKAIESTQVIDSFDFDKDIYASIYDQSEPIQESVAEGDALLRTYPDFAQDLFMAMYKHKPRLLDDSDIKETHQFNSKMLKELMDLDQFRKLRQSTRLDLINSAFGMEALSQNAVEYIRAYVEQMQAQGQDPFGDINDDIDQNGTGGDPVPGQGTGTGQMPGQGQPGQGQGSGQGQPQPGQGQQPNPGAGMSAQDALDKLKEGLGQAVEKTMDDVKDVRDFLNAWGLEGGDKNNRVTFEEKKRALQRLRNSEKVKRLTDLIGRMKKIAINEQRQKAPDGAEAIKSVKTGNQIERILPSEKAMLASKSKAIKSGFYRKYNDKELLEYDMDVYESMGRGPIISCVDTSGSMQGEAERWSKAVALALLESAQKQKRNYACLHYDGRLQDTWEIPYGKLKPEDVFDIAERFSGGGTSFEPPLRKSLELMEDSKFKKGDIVFITDGDSYLDDDFLKEFLEKKAEKEFKVISILINSGYGGASDSTVKLFSDKIIKISDLANIEKNGTKDIFRDIS